MRWISPRTVKEIHMPASLHAYPSKSQSSRNRRADAAVGYCWVVSGSDTAIDAIELVPVAIRLKYFFFASAQAECVCLGVARSQNLLSCGPGPRRWAYPVARERCLSAPQQAIWMHDGYAPQQCTGGLSVAQRSKNQPQLFKCRVVWYLYRSPL